MPEIRLTVSQAVELSSILQSIERPQQIDPQVWQSYIDLEHGSITHAALANLIDYAGDFIVDRLRAVDELPSKAISFGILGGRMDSL